MNCTGSNARSVGSRPDRVWGPLWGEIGRRAPWRLALTGSSFLLLIGLALAGLPAAEPGVPGLIRRLEQGEATTIVCLGDSVTGVYYHTGGIRAYPEMLKAALLSIYPKASLQIINAGISGNSTVDALARLQRDVLDHHPHLVTVMFGLNDMTRVPIEEFRANLTTIITRCRGTGAEVVLCTPNGVIDTPGRPIVRLEQYLHALKQVGTEQKVPICDVYAAYERVRQVNPLDWRLLFSDQIHPNMDGHRLNAREICRTLTDQDAALEHVSPPQPAIAKTLSRIKAGEPVRVLAMPPWDVHVAPALHALDPQVKVEVRLWNAAGKSLAELEQSAREVRKNPAIDLVLLGIPLSATPGEKPTEDQIWNFSWVLNNSLAFGRQEWDVIVVAPSVAGGALTAESAAREEFTRRMVHAQDLNLVQRTVADTGASTAEILSRWFSGQKQLSK